MESLKAFQITQSTIIDLITESMKETNDTFAKAAAAHIQTMIKDFNYVDVASKALQTIVSDVHHIPKHFLFTLSVSLDAFLNQDWSCFYRYMGHPVKISSKQDPDDSLFLTFVAYLEDYFQYECEPFKDFLSNLEVLFPDSRITVRVVKGGIPAERLLSACGPIEGTRLVLYIETPANREACLDFCINK